MPAASASSAAVSVEVPSYPTDAVVDSFWVGFDLTLHNPGPPIADARVDVAITGKSDMAGSQMRLQYASGIWVGPTLQGTANGPGGMAGHLGGEPQGTTLPTGDKTYVMRVGFQPGAPADMLQARFAIDVIDQSTGMPSSTVAAASTPIKVALRSTPSTPGANLTVGSGSTTPLAAQVTNADGIDCNFVNTQPSVGTLTSRGSFNMNKLFNYSAPANYTGTTTFTYTATDPGSDQTSNPPPSSTGTISITVVPATTTLSASLGPRSPTLGNRQTLTVKAGSTGTTTGAVTQAWVQGYARSLPITLHDGTGTVTLPVLGVGRHMISISYSGTTTSKPASLQVADVVSKAASRLSATVSPHRVTTKTKHPDVIVHVATNAGSTTNGLVELYIGRRRLATARAEHGQAHLRLAHQTAGKKFFTVRYLGTSTTSPETINIHLVVHRG